MACVSEMVFESVITLDTQPPKLPQLRQRKVGTNYFFFLLAGRNKNEFVRLRVRLYPQGVGMRKTKRVKGWRMAEDVRIGVGQRMCTEG